MLVFLGIIMPFVGTMLGALIVFFFKKSYSSRIDSFLGGFASGIMLSASMFSLLLPAIEMSEALSIPAFLSTSIGFLLGAGFLILLDIIISRIRQKDAKESKNLNMMFIAITLHNIPEGMAVGAIFAGVLSGGGVVELSSALIFSLGIAIQNFPEGAIISLPFASSGTSRLKSFGYGVLSGAVEPVFAVITLLLASFMSIVLPFFLSFSAGAMIYVVVHELIPDSRGGCLICTIGIIVGFVLMMLLDLSLG